MVLFGIEEKLMCLHPWQIHRQKFFLGRIVDADELYINGKKWVQHGYMYPQRRYSIPDGILKPGKNLFVVRVTNNFGKGGFVPDKPYRINCR